MSFSKYIPSVPLQMSHTRNSSQIRKRRRQGWQRMRWLDGVTNSMDMGLGRLAIGDGQGGLVCCGPWGHKGSDMTERLNWTELKKKGKKIIYQLFHQLRFPTPHWVSRPLDSWSRIQVLHWGVMFTQDKNKGMTCCRWCDNKERERRRQLGALKSHCD